MRKFIPAIMAAAATVAAVSCGNSANRKVQDQIDEVPVEDITPVPELEASDEPIFDIVTNLGTIRVKLFSNTPKHRDNFVKLVRNNFYKGILFHRVIDGFMIQTGDPYTKEPSKRQLYGTGGPGYNIPAEIMPENKHKKGALAAARRGDAANPLRESSGSQFYIVQNPVACAQLDGSYTVFGETLSGFDVIDKIAKVETDMRDCPLNDVRIIKIVPVTD